MHMIQLTLSELLGILAVIVIPGVVAWANLLMRVTRVESRQDAKDEHITELQQAFTDFATEVRRVIYKDSK